MKISIILPLYDRQGTGWKSLESALAQDSPRSSYEVIVIVGGRSERNAMEDPAARAMLDRCDAVVRYHQDLDLEENRVRLCEAGVEVSSGEILYFAEGHTVLHPQCCQLIEAHFATHPSSQVVAAQFHEVPTTDVSRVVDLLKKSRKGKGLETVPMISLGGQIAIKRDLFDTLYHFSVESGMFAEVDICVFIERNNIEVGKINAPLCDHFSARSMGWLIDWLLRTGRTHFDQFDDQRNSFSAYATDLGGWRRAIFSWANRRWFAITLFGPSYALGVLLLRTALSLFRLSEPLALKLHLLGYRLIVLAGFCKARMSKSEKGEVPSGANFRRS